MTPWTVACQDPLSMEFFRQEYWSGLPFLSPGDLPKSESEPTSPAPQADSLPLHYQGSPWNLLLTSLVAQTVKRLSIMWETRVLSLGQEGPWRRKWQSTPVLLPGKSYGQRSLVGYSLRGHKESDTTSLSFTFLKLFLCLLL